jgi:hypothetical protein
MKNEFKITLNNKQEVLVNGVKLIRIMNDAIKAIVPQGNTYLKEKDTYKVKNSSFWVEALGHLYQYISWYDKSGEYWLPCSIKIGNDIEEADINLNKDSIVIFPENKHSYEAISSNTLEICRKYSLTHAALAEILLSRLNVSPYPAEFKKDDKKFLDALIILMFGVECSRNNTTLLTSLMLLDLIATKNVYGSRYVPFDWHSAFVSRYNYHWDDWEKKNYGGKYPMSQQSTGKGNLGQGDKNNPGVLKHGRGHIFQKNVAYELDELQPPDEKVYQYSVSFLMGLFAEYPQRHSVPRREMSLAIYWLNTLNDKVSERLKQAKDQKELEAAIQQVFFERLSVAYTAMRPEFFLKTPLQETIIPLPLHSVKDIDWAVVQLCHFSKKDNKSSYTQAANTNVFHLIDVHCKLIPGWVGYSEEKEATVNDETITITGKIGRFPSLPDDANRCTYCFSHTAQKNIKNETKNTQIVRVDEEDGKCHKIDSECNPKVKSITFEPGRVTKTCSQVMFFGMAEKSGKQECKTCLSQVQTSFQALSGMHK